MRQKPTEILFNASGGAFSGWMGQEDLSVVKVMVDPEEGRETFSNHHATFHPPFGRGRLFILTYLIALGKCQSQALLWGWSSEALRWASLSKRNHTFSFPLHTSHQTNLFAPYLSCRLAGDVTLAQLSFAR